MLGAILSSVNYWSIDCSVRGDKEVSVVDSGVRNMHLAVAVVVFVWARSRRFYASVKGRHTAPWAGAVVCTRYIGLV